MHTCIVGSRKKISMFLECLQVQICFVNDCLIGMDSLIKANENPIKDSVTRGFVTTAFLAMQDDVVITLSKTFDNDERADSVCINNLISILQKNKHCLPEDWQKKNHENYCRKFGIDNYLISKEPDYKFYCIDKAIQQFQEEQNYLGQIIRNINTQRDKHYGHNDKKYITQESFQELVKKNPINRIDLHNVLDKTRLFLHRIAMATNNDLIGDHSFFADNFDELMQ